MELNEKQDARERSKGGTDAVKGGSVRVEKQ